MRPLSYSGMFPCVAAFRFDDCRRSALNGLLSFHLKRGTSDRVEGLSLHTQRCDQERLRQNRRRVEKARLQMLATSRTMDDGSPSECEPPQG